MLTGRIKKQMKTKIKMIGAVGRVGKDLSKV
jgi:hypothetical protein